MLASKGCNERFKGLKLVLLILFVLPVYIDTIKRSNFFLNAFISVDILNSFILRMNQTVSILA